MLLMKAVYKILLLVLIISITIALIFPLYWPVSSYSIKYSRRQLFEKTDYHELLNAGRNILSKAVIEKGIAEDGKKYSRLVIPKDVKIPNIIRRLKLIGNPQTIITDYGCLKIFLGNRLGNFGVIIYPDDFKEPYGNFKYGDKELLPGLWYYDAK
jgi:hypothetical protein